MDDAEILRTIDIQQERFEENRFIRQKEEQQISAMRQEMEETRRMRKELYDQVVLDNTMEDLKHILAGEKISAEAMQRLAEWKTGL